MASNRQPNYFEQQRNEDFGDTRKHPSQYRVLTLQDLIKEVTARYIRGEQLLDTDKLINMVRLQGIVKIHFVGEFWTYPVYIVSKKRLHAVIKRVFNKCLMKKTRTATSSSGAVNSPWVWDPKLEDFVRENPNVIESGDSEIKLNIPQS